MVDPNLIGCPSRETPAFDEYLWGVIAGVVQYFGINQELHLTYIALACTRAMKLLSILSIAYGFIMPVSALADTCQFNSERPMPCTISYKGAGIGSAMTIKWLDGVWQTYRQFTNGGNGSGGRFYIYTDKYGGEWLWGKPSASSRFGLHHATNGNKVYFW